MEQIVNSILPGLSEFPLVTAVPLVCFGDWPPKIMELWRFFWFVPRLCGLTSSDEAEPNMSLLPPPGGFKTLQKKKLTNILMNSINCN